MLPWQSPQRSCCSHSHLLLLLLHLVLQELQLPDAKRKMEKNQNSEHYYEEQNPTDTCKRIPSLKQCLHTPLIEHLYVAWVSEAELKPATYNIHGGSVQRNTGEWLMGCRREGGEERDNGLRAGQGVLGSEAGHSQAAPVASGDTNYRLWSWQKTNMQLSNRAFCSE